MADSLLLIALVGLPFLGAILAGLWARAAGRTGS